MTLEEYVAESRGNASGLAKAIGVSPVLISLWATGKRQVPAKRCTQIEKATNGQVARLDLRPDIFQELPAANTV